MTNRIEHPHAPPGGPAVTTRKDYLLIRGDARRIPLADRSVHCVVTSPPYWSLRDYQVPGQLGLESSPELYVAAMVAVFREVWRVLRDDGTAWLNLGDSYAGSWGNQGRTPERGTQRPINGPSFQNLAVYGDLDKRTHTGSWVNDHPSLKPKDLCLIPERVALALQANGWTVRAKPPWVKPSPLPESVQDRPSTAHESIFLLSKRADYFYDAEAVRTPAIHAGQVVKLGEKSLSKGQANGAGVKPSGNGKADSVVVAAGRNRRTSDWFNESLDEMIAHHEARLAHLKAIRAKGGMLVDEVGDPLALCVASQPFPGSHFATFPQRLITPMVRASTSERGVCPACGAPWVREVERGESDYARLGRMNGSDFGRNDSVPKGSGQTRTANGTVPSLKAAQKQHYGWRPGCTCPAADPIPAVVFDPFAGSGTSLVVANALGRDAIGCDLSADYLQLARRRIERPHAQPPRPGRDDAPFALAGLEVS